MKKDKNRDKINIILNKLLQKMEKIEKKKKMCEKRAKRLKGKRNESKSSIENSLLNVHDCW